MRQGHFRFGATLAAPPPSEAWAIAQGGDSFTPYAVIRLAAGFTFNAWRGIVYTQTIDEARRLVPAGLLCIHDAAEVKRLVRGAPVVLGQIVEVWF